MKRTVHLVLVGIAPFLLFAVVRGAIALASHQLESQYPPPGRMIRVDGHRLHLYCTGRGTPTVLIEPGMGNDWVSWRSVSPKLVERGELAGSRKALQLGQIALRLRRRIRRVGSARPEEAAIFEAIPKPRSLRRFLLQLLQ